MDNNMKAVFELSRSPMLAIEQNIIVIANARAEKLFGSPLCGRSAVTLIPDHILANPSDNFVATAAFDGVSYCVSAAREGGVLYLSLAPDGGRANSAFVNESLMNSMLSSLFNIGLSIDRLRSDSGKERREDYLSILNHNYYSIRHALVNLSSSMALAKGTMPFSFRVTDLARLCSELCSTVSILCRDRGIEIDFSTLHGNLYAWADGEKVERILLNILSNSIAHTPAGGTIRVGLEKSGDTAYISVDDNGCGIPAAEMAELFTKFEQESRSPDLSALSTGGLGLGVARGLAEGHGGALILESRPGKGTAVRIVLPLHSDKFNLLESANPGYVNCGMGLVLTELATVLSSDNYGEKYSEM